MLENDVLRRLERAVMRDTGRTADYLRNTPICDIRREVEKQEGKSMQFGVPPGNIENIYVLGEPIRVYKF